MAGAVVEDGLGFLRRRARDEAELARLATSPEAARAHRALAAGYRARLDAAELAQRSARERPDGEGEP